MNRLILIVIVALLSFNVIDAAIGCTEHDIYTDFWGGVSK
jgi:hypothetical protein